MSKKFAMLLPAALLLASCGGPKGPDPLTLEMAGKGTMQNYKPGVEYPLSIRNNGTDVNVGTLAADGSVNVRITPAQVQAGQMLSFSGFKKNLDDAKCDSTKLTIQDTSYRSFTSFFFTTNSGTASVAYAQSEAKNNDGTTTWTRYGFWFAQKVGSLKGSVVCSGGSSNYDVTLKPGWNIVRSTWTYDPKTETSTPTSFGNVTQGNSYDGNWYAYRIQ